MKKYSLIIFDLDGTILDTSRGILNSVRYAEQNMGLEEAPIEIIQSFLGPPPKTQYQKVYMLNEEDAARATIYHREYGSQKGIYEADIYQGIEELLAMLKQVNVKIAVATLKRQDIATKILGEFGLVDCFDRIIGMDENESFTKADLLENACKTLEVDLSDAVLIGDSNYDAIGAMEANMDFIAVTYGYGFHSVDDLSDYKHVAVCKDVRELSQILLR